MTKLPASAMRSVIAFNDCFFRAAWSYLRIACSRTGHWISRRYSRGVLAIVSRQHTEFLVLLPFIGLAPWVLTLYGLAVQ